VCCLLIGSFLPAVLCAQEARAHNQRGMAFQDKGEYDKAIADCDVALRLDPKYCGAYCNRAYARKKKGEYQNAIADYNEAIRIDSKYAEAYEALAWLQATCPGQRYRDGTAALANANRAYELSSGKGWSCIDTLAAAYAESGDCDAAKQWAAKALTMASAEKDKEELRSRLKLYEAGQPYREMPYTGKQ
jgi:tetratricopeptide (TPR) repeat protein